MDKAAVLTPDVEYFVQRGFVGFQINYRLGEDNASWPQGVWPAKASGATGGAELGLQQPIPDGGVLAASQRFRFGEGGATGMVSLASDSELCVVARAPGGSVAMQPCPVGGSNASNASNASTYQWRVGADGSFVGVGGHFDQKCLGTQAPSSSDRSFVGRMAFRCNSSAPSQRWHVSGHGLTKPSGGQICHPSPSDEHSSTGRAADPPVDSGCLSFAGGFQPPLSHLYPAVRDTKAAVRWLRAGGVKAGFKIDPDYITLAGGSAGACTILGAGICQLQGDFTTEIPPEVDPTIASTHPKVSSAVRSMIVHWGAPFAVDAVTTADPRHRSRYARAAVAGAASEAPLPSIIAYNGLVDTTIPIEHILEAQRAYAAANGTMVVRPLPGEPHACWDATVVVGNRTLTMPEDAFVFIRQVQKLPPIYEPQEARGD